MTLALLSFLPNLVTLARLLAVPLVVWLILTGQWMPAFWIFFAASITDGLDGFLARSLDARSQLGAYLDAIPTRPSWSPSSSRSARPGRSRSGW